MNTYMYMFAMHLLHFLPMAISLADSVNFGVQSPFFAFALSNSVEDLASEGIRVP